VKVDLQLNNLPTTAKRKTKAAPLCANRESGNYSEKEMQAIIKRLQIEDPTTKKKRMVVDHPRVKLKYTNSFGVQQPSE